jgi:predicted MPP superfamily phosphohydrolase
MHHRKLSRRGFLKLTGSLVLRAAAVSAGGLGYVGLVEPNWVDVNPVRIALPRLPLRFDGYKIAQISDIHMGDWLDRDKLLEIVGLINGEQPDLVTITGDFVTRRPELSANDLTYGLSKLVARDGVVGVLGNHDYSPTSGVIREVMREGHIINVSNGIHTVERGPHLLHIAGVDDVWRQQADIEMVLGKLHAEGAALLLAHEPDFADTSAATGRFDMQISGHSHGGQVSIPFVGPIRLPPFGTKYPVGLYRVGGMLQYTNRGVGMVRPHVRFNCRPEITLFTLQAASTLL